MTIRELIKYVKNRVDTEDVDTSLLKVGAGETRKKNRKNWHLKNMTPRYRAGFNRAISHISRREKSYTKKSKRVLTRRENLLLLRRSKPSKLLDSLYPDRKKAGVWKKLQNRKLSYPDTDIDLNDFSFLSEPQATIDSLVDIAKAEAKAPGMKINFGDMYCLDVCPFMLLVECWAEMIPIFEGGDMDFPMQKVLAAVGITEAMNITPQGVSEYSNVWAFPLQRRLGLGASESKNRYMDRQPVELTTDRFCDALNSWLAQAKTKNNTGTLKLNEDGVGWIKALLGELLENAERHSDGDRRDGSWAISGFMARREENDEFVYRIQVGIVSIGDTFSESLKRATFKQKDRIEAYLSDMKKLGAKQSNSTLRTLAALQDGVTCVQEADEDGRGGYGLMEMLALSNLLGATAVQEKLPKITIISGASCIMLNDPYTAGHITDGTTDGPRYQWCNSENTAKSLPDDANVFDLQTGLPGTVISIGLTLDTDYLKEVFDNGSQNDSH